MCTLRQGFCVRLCVKAVDVAVLISEQHESGHGRVTLYGNCLSTLQSIQVCPLLQCRLGIDGPSGAKTWVWSVWVINICGDFEIYLLALKGFVCICEHVELFTELRWRLFPLLHVLLRNGIFPGRRYTNRPIHSGQASQQ